MYTDRQTHCTQTDMSTLCLLNNNHISEQIWVEAVEGSCSRCHTLELAHYQYAKNDPDLLLTSSQISLYSKEIPPDCRRSHHFSKVSTPWEGDTPSNSHLPWSFRSLGYTMPQSFSLESFPLLSSLKLLNRILRYCTQIVLDYM